MVRFIISSLLSRFFIWSCSNMTVHLGWNQMIIPTINWLKWEEKLLRNTVSHLINLQLNLFINYLKYNWVVNWEILLIPTWRTLESVKLYCANDKVTHMMHWNFHSDVHWIIYLFADLMLSISLLILLFWVIRCCQGHSKWLCIIE